MSLYQQSVVQMSKMLRNLDVCLDKAVAFAEAKSFSPDEFVSFRLAPDMRALAFQVQTSCDSAKYAGARLAGVEAPALPDTETTIEALKQRIAATLDFLNGLTEAQFEGAADREVRPSFLPGKGARGEDYLHEMALPNFYFHLTTAYALLRMSGVDLGKHDFIGSVTLHDLDS